MKMQEDLVFDIGMNNGDDTALYLSKGYRVVAVEANPLLVEQAAQRFKCEISEARVNLQNVGIAETQGKLEFWVNETLSEWSSFRKEIAGRDGHPLSPVTVDAVRLESLLEAFGVPRYMKIDIEGYDGVCLESLHQAERPAYLSVEFNHSSLLEQARALGYTKFKVIDQFTHKALGCRLHPPYSYFENLYNLAAKQDSFGSLAQEICGHRKLWTLVKRMRTEISAGFVEGSSGPFGEDADGVWLGYDQALEQFRAVEAYIAGQGSVVPLWCDLHAKLV